jgi:hypothetical protein
MIIKPPKRKPAYKMRSNFEINFERASILMRKKLRIAGYKLSKNLNENIITFLNYINSDIPKTIKQQHQLITALYINKKL